MVKILISSKKNLSKIPISLELIFRILKRKTMKMMFKKFLHLNEPKLTKSLIKIIVGKTNSHNINLVDLEHAGQQQLSRDLKGQALRHDLISQHCKDHLCQDQACRCNHQDLPDPTFQDLKGQILLQEIQHRGTHVLPILEQQNPNQLGMNVTNYL